MRPTDLQHALEHGLALGGKHNWGQPQHHDLPGRQRNQALRHHLHLPEASGQKAAMRFGTHGN